ncbi:methyltransferase [Nonomuraea dietziae]|uniref:O-methyltransferase n=1 Tax=Nonomuraea dietziae TaxID=65515 RepID=A0A7W5VAR2_9ACTN|nr:methyltransferase [Nonomuraea dietziae]MBB3732644.1 hypothetical protein [Nonomuraea dietziae]
MPLALPPDEARAFLQGQAPAPMLDLVGMMACHAVTAGLRLGLFDALAEGARDLPWLSAELKADPEALTLLLDLLVRTGYLEREEHGYANSAASAASLCTGSPTYYGHVLPVWHAIVGELWDGLADAVRTGRPPGGFYPWLEQRPRLSAAFHTLQGGLASWLAEEVVELAGPLEGATCLLDLGGGHGLYSEAFCRAHPRLTATVVDLPGALEDGTTHERVTRHAADLAKEGVDGEYDVVLLFNVLHGFPEDEARGLLARAAGAVRQGGRLLVLETVLEPTDEHRGGQAEAAFTAGFSLSLWHTQGGAVRPARTIEDWLGEAGCVALARHELSRSATHTLFIAAPAGREALR